MSQIYDVTIIGGGIVGCATAMALSKNFRVSVLILESESSLAKHQTGHNSGVIHSGLYYKPGSLKANNCTQGRESLINFCEEHKIPYEMCGKIVVATQSSQIKALEELENRGKLNGLQNIKRLSSQEEIRAYEPNVVGIAGLHVPYTGIIDYIKVTETYAAITEQNGGKLQLNAKLIKYQAINNEIILETTAGEFKTRNLINCGGLQCDRIAKLCGLSPGVQIVPFRGEYYEVDKSRHHLVKNLVYPVPDPRFPFLGVHFTRKISGGIEAGPNAVLAFKREGYRKSDISLSDIFQYGTYSGFWLMAMKYWNMGLQEMYRSYCKRAFLAALNELIPDLTLNDLVPGGSGVRAQALSKSGKLLDDFHIVKGKNMIHVLNAPSPAATASISIGEMISQMAETDFALSKK